MRTTMWSSTSSKDSDFGVRLSHVEVETGSVTVTALVPPPELGGELKFSADLVGPFLHAAQTGNGHY